tara:strand:+ start:101653 stop:103659 length:2007 start_codon:yes stop_codon:yes gene_type:complete
MSQSVRERPVSMLADRVKRIASLVKAKRFQRCLVALSAAVLVVGVAAYAYVVNVAANHDHHFRNLLSIPPQDEGEVVDGQRRFKLVLAASEMQFFRGQSTATAGINGPFLGPTLRAHRGDDVSLTVENRLDEMTTMHWHGMHVPAVMDGTPHQPIDPGASWTASFPIDQSAATLWYHPHPHGSTGDQVYSGLAGQFWIDDEVTDALALPSTYGINDFPLTIQDRSFTANGQFRLPGGLGYGDTMLVNGTVDPLLNVNRRQIRFRILNGSNGRIYHIGFEDNRNFLQIATDGGLLETPVETSRVVLSPGERAEIVVDFSDGKSAMLKSFPEAGFLQTAEMVFSGLGSGNINLLRIEPNKSTVASDEPEPIDPTTVLCSILRLDEKDAVVTRKIALGGPVRQSPVSESERNETGETSQVTRGAGNGPGGGARQARALGINGKTMDMHRVDERVRLGDTEIWELSNATGIAHPFHVHLVQFQLLSRNGNEPTGADLGWKDTILVHPGDRIRIIMKFDKYSDPRTPYMYHCHITAHEDNGMMGQFLVVKEPSELDLLRDQSAVVVFVYGLDCEHCFDQVKLFDRELSAANIPLVVVTPEKNPSQERRESLACPVVSDPASHWAGWFKMLHEGPAHGTLLVGTDGEVVWSSTEDTPYMDVDVLIKRYRQQHVK